jgi:hypothetical protein
MAASDCTAGLQLLHEVCGAAEEHAPTILHQGEAENGGQVRLAAAGQPNINRFAAFSRQLSPAA